MNAESTCPETFEPRYAVYFAPDRHSPWHDFGASWLGRDEFDNRALPQPALAGISPSERAQITREPARYGFHATLKAPFELQPATTEQDLCQRLKALADTLATVPLGGLRLTQLDGFVALVPTSEPATVQALAERCVVALDDLRAPLSDAQQARRLRSPLDARQLELLALYGYPHVLERFRFHMTLTGPVAPAIAQRVISALAGPVEALNRLEPPWLDRLCLFVERAPGAPFHRILDLTLRA